MKISTKGRYALRMMLDLAEHRADGYVALRDIAERQSISKKYLEQIIPVFTQSGLLLASRGHQGGYRLAKAPEQYTVYTILHLTEGDLAPVACAGQEPAACTRRADCPTLPIWQGLNRVIRDYLDHITLQDIMEQQQEQDQNNYVI